VLATLFLALAATAHPVQRFAASYPESKRIGSPDGRVLSHAGGFVFESAARGMEAVARDFLSTYGSAFGVRRRGCRRSRARLPGEYARPAVTVSSPGGGGGCASGEAGAPACALLLAALLLRRGRTR